MKIQADKIDREPTHGLRVSEVRRVLAVLPAEWTADVAEIRLSNALQQPDCAYFSGYDHTLHIYSRGRRPRNLIAPILTELVSHHLGFRRRRFHRLSETDAHRVAHIIEPFVNQIVSEIFPSLAAPVYHPSFTIHPVSLTNENA